VATFVTPCHFCGADFNAERTTARFCSDGHRARSRAEAREARYQLTLAESVDAFRAAMDDILARYSSTDDPATLRAISAEVVALTPETLLARR